MAVADDSTIVGGRPARHLRGSKAPTGPSKLERLATCACERITRRAVALLGAAALCWFVSACGEGSGRERLASTAPLSDIEATPEGGLLAAERESGRILRIGEDGYLDELAQVEVMPGPGQRDLLGIVSDGTTVYAAFTRGDGRLVVAEVAPGEQRLVWRGPPSADAANGGRLALTDEGLLIGVGDLTEPDLVGDPRAPNGKLLLLDPFGRPDQEPRVISTGWNNPFAFTVADDGSVRVADNAPGDAPERLARGDTPRPSEVVELKGTTAPSGVLSDGDDLLVCGYVSGELRRHRRGSRDFELVSDGCRYDVARLASGRLALADDDGVILLEAP